MSHNNNEIYSQNKSLYKRIKTFSQSGGEKTSWKLFDDNERKSITNDFNDIAGSDKKCESHSLKKIINATKGMSAKSNYHLTNKFKPMLCNNIRKTIKNNKDPISIKEDSFTAWTNQAVERFGLTVGDIMKMKFGDTMKLILMDRNSGESIPETIKVGSKFDPTEHGFSYATYIHGEGLSGLLKFDDIEVIHAPFDWELNVAALGSKYFWGPVNCGGCVGRPKVTSKGSKNTKKLKNNKSNQIDISKLDQRILVGWRGPAVRMDYAKKHMPRYVTKYDRYDYPSFRYTNYLTKK